MLGLALSFRVGYRLFIPWRRMPMWGRPFTILTAEPDIAPDDLMAAGERRRSP
jgi:hypothetical protein